MHLHEYQTKQILHQYGISSPSFFVINSLDEVDAALKTLELTKAVIKVQVHAGGRGKAGGIRIARTRQEVEVAVKELLGMKIVNNQTGKEGIVVRQIMITAITEIKKEYYLAATIDRHRAQGVIIASPEGGVDIEEVAMHHPERIAVIPMTLQGHLQNYQLIEISKLMGWKGPTIKQGKLIITNLARAFVDTDAELLEINPLVETVEGDLIALDAKLTVDVNALFRQKNFASLYDPSQVSPSEAWAQEHDLAYISLDGDIGCMVNGAGLAMATMDIIKFYGGTPANFLDVGGGASEDKIAEGFKIILKDPKVKAILVNIFGGIMNCVTLAAGIVASAGRLHVPLVVRMEGTNVERGRQILKDSGLNIILTETLDEAAKRVVDEAKA